MKKNREDKKPNLINYGEIEKDSLLAKDDPQAKERLANRLLPIIRFLTNYYKWQFPDWDESEMFFVINKAIDYAVENHDEKKGKFIHYLRFLVKKAIVRASINHNKRKNRVVNVSLEEEKIFVGDGYFNQTETISNNIFLQGVLEKGLDKLQIQYLIQALLWSHSFTALEISQICETNTTTVRRNIQKVLNFISEQAKLKRKELA